MAKTSGNSFVWGLMALLIIATICGSAFLFGKASDPFSTKPSVKAVDTAYATRAAVETHATATAAATTNNHAVKTYAMDETFGAVVRGLGVLMGLVAIGGVLSFGGIGVYRFYQTTHANIGVIRQNARGQLPLVRNRDGSYFNPALMTTATLQLDGAQAQQLAQPLSPEMQLRAMALATQAQVAVALASQETTPLTEVQERQMLRANVLPVAAQPKPQAQVPPDAVTAEFRVADDDPLVFVANDGQEHEIK